MFTQHRAVEHSTHVQSLPMLKKSPQGDTQPLERKWIWYLEVHQDGSDNYKHMCWIKSMIHWSDLPDILGYKKILGPWRSQSQPGKSNEKTGANLLWWTTLFLYVYKIEKKKLWPPYSGGLSWEVFPNPKLAYTRLYPTQSYVFVPGTSLPCEEYV